ncbi:MAG: tetratricopeptide repeat protein [Planctomycetia bacterium]|nr:tetratricopeptide repeat protein [Planctomycetia bacterium]
MSWLLLLGCRAVPFSLPGSKSTRSLTLSREGVAAYERRNYEAAQEKLQAAIELNGKDTESRRYYAESLWMQGERDESITSLEQALEHADTLDSQILIYQSLGEKNLALGRTHEALVAANRLIALAPEKYEGWAIRGNAKWQLGQQSAAMADLHKALYYSPDNRDILWLLANLQTEMGKTDSALATWQHLGRLYSKATEPAEVLYGKAVALAQLGRVQESAESLELAVARSPNRGDYYRMLAELRLKCGDARAALLAAGKAVELNPNDAATQQIFRQVREFRLAEQPKNRFF